MRLPKPLINVKFIDGEDSHLYTVDGRDTPFVGVTTILRILGKPALIPWAAKKAAEAYSRKLEEFLRSDESDLGAFDMEAVAKWAASAPNRERDTAGAKGTDVHGLVEDYVVHGIVPDLTKLSEPVSKSFLQFEDWFSRSGFKIIAGDTPLISVDMEFGGRMDALCLDSKDRIVLVDFKTSKGVYADHFVQLGGYSLALMETYGIRPNRCGILHIRPDKCEWHEGDLNLSEQAFRKTVEIYHLMKKIESQMEERNDRERQR